MNKKVSLILLCGFMALSLCGCGNEKENVEEKIMTYKCEYQNDDTLESMEFIYNDNSKQK